MCSSEQLEGGVVREDGVGPRRRCQEWSWAQGVGCRPGRDHGVLPPSCELQPPGREVVLQTPDGPGAAARRRELARGLFE